MVLGLDGKNWFSFETPAHLGHLLRCGRSAVETVVTRGLTGALGRLSPHHRLFLSSLNSFLVTNTGFEN